MWTYDAAGNIICRDEYSYSTGTLDYPDTTFDYYYSTSGWGDLLTEDDEKCYDYDGMGNRVYDDYWDYEWQKGRQLHSMFNGASNWIFTYNADGMRIGRVDSESGTEYTYYYNGSLLRVMTVDGNKLYFVYDAAGRPIEVSYTPAGSTTVGFYYFVTNLQGDVIAILNSSGAVVVEYTYDAWGKILSITGSMASTLGVQNPLRYRGYVYDQETSLYYLQSRYYDPEIGRFINADVFTSTGQGLLGNNMFAYCLNNPVNSYDPTGNASYNVFYKVCCGGASTHRSQYEQYILEAGQEFGVDPAMVATAIAVEQANNVNIFDLADVPAGLIGVDTSIGVGQVKISTAETVENANYIEKSQNHWDRVWRLTDRKTNIRYVAAYLAYVRDIWIQQFPGFERHPDIWWTVYNTGRLNAHPNPAPGLLGAEANTFYAYYSWRFGQ